MRILLILTFLLRSLPAQASLFGEESVPLWKLVVGQVTELERLAKLIGATEEQRELLIELNRGVENTTQQIDAIESLIQRAQGLDPISIQNLSDVNSKLQEFKDVLSETQELLALKTEICEQAIAQSALQSDTAYKMGQEMIRTGSDLAIESKTASPGRSGQITAAAASSQMLASGVQLQTLAQIAQVQALSLELQKSQIQKEIQIEDYRRSFFIQQLSGKSSAVRNTRSSPKKRLK